MAEPVKCSVVGAIGSLRYGAGVAGCSVGLEMAFLNDSSSSTGVKVEAWGQWQLAETEGSGPLLQPQPWTCRH